MEKGEDRYMCKIRSTPAHVLLAILIIACLHTHAQDSVWTLDRSIAYAKANNLGIQQNVLNERVAKMQWEQSRLSMLPNISMSSSYGRNFGRSIDPTTNTFNNTVYDFTGLSGSAGVLLFGWFQKRNAIAKSGLMHLASESDLSQAQNDVALNVSTGYLRVLLAQEQISVSLNQLNLTAKQVTQTESLLKAGRSNGLDMAQVKAQLITDSANLVKAQLASQQALIDIKALLNLELNLPFNTLSVDGQYVEQVQVLEPEIIYQQAASSFGSVKSAQIKIKAAEKDLSIAKANLYPQLNFSASSGSNYSSTYNEVLPDGQSRVMPLGKQLQNNFSQSIYLGLSIPVFNGLSSRYAIKQAKAGIQNATIQSEQVKRKLKQDIYKACNEASAASQSYKIALSALAMAHTALDFAQKRYEKGLIAAIDLLSAQNAVFKANADSKSAKYDLIFKRMVIDYYLGNDI